MAVTVLEAKKSNGNSTVFGREVMIIPATSIPKGIITNISVYVTTRVSATSSNKSKVNFFVNTSFNPPKSTVSNNYWSRSTNASTGQDNWYCSSSSVDLINSTNKSSAFNGTELLDVLYDLNESATSNQTQGPFSHSISDLPGSIQTSTESWSNRELYVGAILQSGNNKYWGNNASCFQIYLTYYTNTPPNKPTINYPAIDNAIIYNSYPWFGATAGSDSQGDPQKLDYRIINGSGQPVVNYGNNLDADYFLNTTSPRAGKCQTYLSPGSYTIYFHSIDSQGGDSGEVDRVFTVATPVDPPVAGTTVATAEYFNNYVTYSNNINAWYGSSTRYGNVSKDSTIEARHFNNINSSLDNSKHISRITTLSNVSQDSSITAKNMSDLRTKVTRA